MKVTLRSATENDIAEILKIVNHAILHTTANYNYEAQTFADQQLWLSHKYANNFPVIVAQYNGAVIGFATYGTFREKIGYRFTVEHSVYVAEGFSGHGIGSSLLTALIEIAKNEKIRVMVGAIDAENDSSIVFHKKFGFTECGIVKDAAFKFDRWLDLQFMQLILK